MKPITVGIGLLLLTTIAPAAEPKEAQFSHLEFVRCQGTPDGTLVGGNVSLFLTREEARELLGKGTPASGTVIGLSAKPGESGNVHLFFGPVYSGVPVKAYDGKRLSIEWKYYRGVHTFEIDLEKKEGRYRVRIPTGTTVDERLSCVRDPLF